MTTATFTSTVNRHGKEKVGSKVHKQHYIHKRLETKIYESKVSIQPNPNTNQTPTLYSQSYANARSGLLPRNLILSRMPLISI